MQGLNSGCEGQFYRGQVRAEILEAFTMEKKVQTIWIMKKQSLKLNMGAIKFPQLSCPT